MLALATPLCLVLQLQFWDVIRAISLCAASVTNRKTCWSPAQSPQPSRLPLSCLKTIFPLSPDWIVPSHALKSGEHPNQTPSWWELWVSPCGECHSCCFQFVSVLEVTLVVFSLSPSRLLFADVNAGERVQTNSVATASASNST